MACVSFGCDSHSSKKSEENRNVTFHRFPVDHNIRKIWIKAVRRDFWEPSKYSRLCSKHFTSECYVQGSKRKTLRSGAVPTQFEGYPAYFKSVPNKSQSQKKKEYANDSTDEDSPEIKQENSEGEYENEAEKDALVTEKVFLKSISYKKKQPEDGDTQSKRVRLDTSEVSFHYTEELYEFGKFVAEQLLCLDVEEARVAQKEIREVLSKFLMNKTTRCLAEPSISNAQPLKDEHYTPAVAQVNPVASSIPKSRITVNPDPPVFSHVNIFGPPVEQSDSQNKTTRSSVTQSGSQKKTARLSVTQSGSQKKTARSSVTRSGSQKKTARLSVTQSGSQKKTARLSVTRSGSQKKTARLSVTRSGSQKKTARSSVTQSGSQNTARSSVTQSGSPKNTAGPLGQSGRIFKPALAKFAVLNANPSTSSAPRHGYLVVPAGTGPGFNFTQLGDTERILLTEIGSTVSKTGSSPVLPALSPITQSGSSNVIFCGTPVKTEPESELSHSAGKVVPISVTESLEIKNELDSEEET